MSEHPIIKQAANLPQDIREMARHQAQEWDELVQRIEAMQPGDATAEEMLRHAANLLASVTVNYGPIHGWLLSQRHMICRHATRMFGQGQGLFGKPNWTEQQY